jgi:hypothetical protein
MSSLSLLKEIKLDLSWLRNWFINKRYTNLQNMLDLNKLPQNCWILDMKYDDNGEFIKSCASKYPQINFVFFHEISHASPEEYTLFKSSFPANVHVFYMKPNEFVNNMNQVYNEFISINYVGYRRCIATSIVDNANILSKIDKSFYKNYGNTLPSMLLIVDDIQLRESSAMFKQHMNQYYAINDFYPN